MNKRYCLFSIMFGILLFVLIYILIYSNSNTYVTMSSILIPIIIGVIINYENNQKKKYKLYYLPLFHYIKTYYDIFSQPNNYITIPKKYEMMQDLSKDMLDFLNKNLNYASEELSDILAINLFYKYKNSKVSNEDQDVYNINRILPIITKELLESYNSLHLDQYIMRKYYLNKEYRMVNGILFFYVDSFLINLARQKEYVVYLDECVKFYQMLDSYREKNSSKYYKIYKYIKRNRNKNVDFLIKELNSRFNIKIKKLK